MFGALSGTLSYVRTFTDSLRFWGPRRWLAAAFVAAVTIVIVGVPTVLIANPWFDRDVPVTWWAWPSLVVTAALAGMLTASYVRSPLTPVRRDRQGKAGVVGGVVSFFAVGCPVCNKLVLLALGTSGALTYFQPIQPALALVSVGLLAWALTVRLKREDACPARLPETPQPATADR